MSSQTLSSGLTLRSLAGMFLAHAHGYYRRGDGTPTREAGNLASTLQDFCRRLPADTVAAGLPIHAVNSWRDSMVARNLSRSYVNQSVARVKRMYRWAVESQILSAADAANVMAVRNLRRFRTVARESVDRNVPTLLECYRIIDAIPTDAAQVRAILQLLCLTGARVGEIASCRVDDIVLDGEPRIMPRQHKSAHHGKTRIIPLCDEAAVIVRQQMAHARDGFLFPSHRRAGKPVTTNWIQVTLRRASTAQGNKITPHTLRHAVARAVRQRASLDAACALLGHSSVQTTERYAPTPLTAAVLASRSIVSALAS